ncbi:MAG: type III pantothenate kinase [Cytophagaceae bacterium]
MNNLVIDEGNTRIKVARFSQNELQEVRVFDVRDDVLTWVSTLSIQACILSTVRETDWDMSKFPSIPFKMKLDTSSKLPVRIPYSTLGTDRLASACGAASLYPSQTCLVLDAGTCLTHTFITSEKEVLGGSISPGLQMRFKSLNHFTGKLPLIEKSKELPETTGKNTQEAIQSGVIGGMVAEISHIIEHYHTKHPDLIVLMTGGDASYFEKTLKEPIFVVPELTLVGLNSILHYNVS